MNLGDGLKFELQNGKPTLVLAHYGLDPKDTKKVPFKSKIQKQPLKSKQMDLEAPVIQKPQFNQERIVTQHSNLKKNASEVSRSEPEKGIPKQKTGGTLKENTNKDLLVQVRSQTGPTKTRSDSDKRNGVKRTDVSRQEKPKPQKPKPQKTVSADLLRESLVCLTQEQLQQILATVGQAARENEKQVEPVCRQAESAETNNAADAETTEESVTGLLQNIGSRPTSEQRNTLEADKAERSISSGLFSTLGERERGRETLQEKKAQWKKGLDEQMAMKKLQKGSPEGVMKEYNPWGRPGAGAPCNTLTPVPFGGSSVEETRVIKTASALEDPEKQAATLSDPPGKTSFSSPDLPAAIRTAFVLGEAAPADHAFSARKREQQALWLAELDRQREGDRLRKRQARLQQTQDHEDHERWAMHFDSLQKKPLVSTERPELEPEPLSLHPERLESIPPSVTACVSRADSLGRASVDSSVGGTQKASFLRSMTALLDPVQIEERERKRQKQLDHQRSIEAQVEERRRQRQLEEQQRRQEEQEEERRLQRERESIERQCQDEAKKQSLSPLSWSLYLLFLLSSSNPCYRASELQTRQTNELYLSMQRAQEEAMKEKQEQRMKDLLRKGHDISNLQRNMEVNNSHSNQSIAPSSLAGCLCDSGEAERPAKMSQDLHSPRKDTGVQTGTGVNTNQYFKSSTLNQDQRTQMEMRQQLCAGLLSCEGVLSMLHPSQASAETRTETCKFNEKPNPLLQLSESWISTAAQTEVGMMNPVQEHAAAGLGRGLTTQTPDIPVEYKHPPNTKKTKRDSRPPDRRNGKENVYRQDNPYEPFSRTERRPGKQLERNGKKPEWNTNKPGKQFVPASARYPSELQREREENRQRRQQELLQLAERNQPPQESSPSPAPQPSHRQGQPTGTKKQHTQRNPAQKEHRSPSPPVPALKHRLHPLQHNPSKPPAQTQPFGTPKELQQDASSSERPPSAHFIPYVRTDEVYRLDPDAPVSTPSTHDPQYRRHNVSDHARPIHSSGQMRDPLLNPELVKNKDRQQAILKGLSALRQGLLQKQRELEVGLSPLLMNQDGSLSPPFQPI
ncbi:coiled-coil domain-containing protein 66 [Polyodon spathula]|uniref:coiled-coil domain-containing protein 66 n=1 Tax=Polyodon spathula TaxID=7913 RepID=UPI001B7F386E|nr:coiled-coil domain-containing protein 66 [Polyodon spathula]